MYMSLTKRMLQDYIVRQLDMFFPDEISARDAIFHAAFDLALERQEFCLSHISLPGYTRDGSANFSHLYADQYSTFLYYLSNSIWQMHGDERICSKLILLNKMLNGCWFSYKAKLPNIFVLGHPVGTILGNADYEDYLVVFQNVTVNTDYTKTEDAPHLGKGLILFAGAKIIGGEPIGDHVTIGVDATVYKQEIPSNTLVYRDRSGTICMKEHGERSYFYDYFKRDVAYRI